MIIVSLSGPKQSGKDSVAGFLTEDGWQRIGFADALKAAALDVNPWISDELGVVWRLSYLIEKFGWEYTKEQFLEARQFLQDLGVAIRDHVNKDAWVQVGLAQIKSDKVVFTDTRFPNELEALRIRGALMVQVVRPGTGAGDGHISEHAWRDFEFDLEITNDGTLEELGDVTKVLAGYAKSWCEGS